MHNISYLDEEPLNHLDSTKNIKSFLWKMMYKRVKKKLNSELINPINMKRIIFNRYFINGLKYNSPLPNVLFQRVPSWYIADNEKEYYLPLSISFSNDKVRFDLVLIDGDIDLRNVIFDSSKNIVKHAPILLVKNLNMLEFCFELLIKHLEKIEENFNK